MPWELGYFDGSSEKVAILPVLNDGQSTDRFQGQEYLGLYPYVTRNTPQGGNAYTLWICESESIYVRFDSWLNGEQPRIHQ